MDPLNYVVPECIDLILQHLIFHQVLNLTLVSPTWSETVHNSSVAMRRMTFVLRPESYQKLQKSSRRYQSIRVLHDDIMIQKQIFLSPILQSLRFLRSLSFYGTFDKLCIEDFFNNIGRLTHNFRVEHLTFYGNVANINFLIRKFIAIKEYETITLIAFEKESFRSIFNQLRTKKSVLCGMKIRNFCFNETLRNDCVNELHLSTTKIDKNSIKALLESFRSLKVLKIENEDLMKSNAQRAFIEANSSRNLEVKIISNPSVDHFLLLCNPEVQNLIFQHFSGEDLLNVSLVSKIWFNLSKSKVSENLKYNLISSMITKRTYDNVETTLNESISSFIRIHPYTSTMKELTLEIKPKSISSLVQLFSFRRFNNLKLLNVTCHEQSSLDDLRLPTSLEFLYLTNFTLGHRNQSTSFFEFLAEAKGLKDLQFYETKGLESLFTTNISNRVRFKLRRLRLFIDETNSEVSKNFQSFINSQAQSLEGLSLNQIHAETVNAIAQSSCLTSLEVRSIDNEIRSMEFRPKIESLFELKVPTLHFEDAKILMKLAPKLRKIYMFCLSHEFLQFLEKKFTFLEELNFTRREKMFHNDFNINKSLKLRRKPFYGE